MKQTTVQRRLLQVRTFLAAFNITLCVILIGGGFLVADINTRAVTFGDGTLSYAVSAGDALRQLPGGEEESAALWDLLPAPLRAVTWVLEGERTVLRWLTQF